jgi:hypothetical protein
MRTAKVAFGRRGEETCIGISLFLRRRRTRKAPHLMNDGPFWKAAERAIALSSPCFEEPSHCTAMLCFRRQREEPSGVYRNLFERDQRVHV